MKKLLYKFAVLLATFVIGVSAYSVLHRYNPTSLCDIEKHPQLYTFGEVHLRGVFEKTKYGITTGCFCDELNAPGAYIELAPNEVAKFPLPESPITANGRDRVYLMDAVIVGQLDKDIGMGCFAPKYQIKNAKVVRVISIREFDNHDKAVEWLKSNSY